MHGTVSQEYGKVVRVSGRSEGGTLTRAFNRTSQKEWLQERSDEQAAARRAAVEEVTTIQVLKPGDLANLPSMNRKRLSGTTLSTMVTIESSRTSQHTPCNVNEYITQQRCRCLNRGCYTVDFSDSFQYGTKVTYGTLRNLLSSENRYDRSRAGYLTRQDLFEGFKVCSLLSRSRP
eukprot:2757620-Pyramimonas_sp.AAC.1